MTEQSGVRVIQLHKNLDREWKADLYDLKTPLQCDTECLRVDHAKMTTNFSSSNPFRRKGPLSSSTVSSAPIHTAKRSTSQDQSADLIGDQTCIERQDVPKKIPKKVRVQSPPPPSPSIAESTSTIGDDLVPFENPTLLSRDNEQDPFGNITPDISEDEGEAEDENKPSKTQIPNPFSKTLDSMDNPGRDALGISPTNITSPGRASMDVDAFKRLLMTGDAGLPSAPPQPPLVHALKDEGGSSTDTSSLSRQSIFEPIQEPHPESPRSSHEILEPEDVGRTMSESSSLYVKKKPPPPSSRHHGKLIKMELRDDPTAVSPLSPPQSRATSNPQYFPFITSTPNRSLTDLDKPLPPVPPRGSGESDRDSPFDEESAGKIPEPPSPSTSINRKAAPPPPLTRRHSQLVSDSKSSRSNSGRLPTRVEEDDVSVYSMESGRPRSNSGKAPPPPPTRKHGLSRAHSQHATSSSSTSLPIPPPTRTSSKRRTETPILHVSKRASMQGPPPPPRPRQARNSLDVSLISPPTSTRVSGEHRRSSNASSMSQASPNEGHNIINSTSGQINILADLSALQQEIDALRNRSQQRQRSVT